jgi:CheY-like chemotaxis protein/CBS domain-containing protein
MGGDGDKRVPVGRRGTTAAVRATDIVGADGEAAMQLAVYCPGCGEWHSIEGGRAEAERAIEAWAERNQVPGDDAWGRTPISEIMTRRVTCVRTDMPVEQLATLFVDRKVGGAPVVDSRGDLVGVVTRGDLLRFGWEGASSDESLDDDPGSAGWSVDDKLGEVPFGDATGVTVAEIMTPFAFSLPSHAPIAQAAALMSYEGVHRVIVTSTDGVIVGLLAGIDIMRWVAQQAGYIIPDRADRHEADVQIAGMPGTAPSVATARKQPGEPGAKPRLVMIVDDDAAVREDYAELLREEGYQVLTAANGLEALDQLQAVRTPSLILLDLKMPVMDGWQLHERLARDPQLGKVPVVLLSGSSDVFEEASRMSADDFLLKPVPVRELLGTVEQYSS